MEEKFYLSLDLSTQTLKAMVVNDSLKILKESVINFDRDLPEFGTNGGVHQQNLEATSPVQMWVKAIDVLLSQLKEGNIEISKIVGISGTGQQHGSVYWKYGAQEHLRNLDPSMTMSAQLKVCILSKPY